MGILEKTRGLSPRMHQIRTAKQPDEYGEIIDNLNIRARGRPGPSPLQLSGAYGPLGVACKMAVRAVSCAVNASCIPRSNELR